MATHGDASHHLLECRHSCVSAKWQLWHFCVCVCGVNLRALHVVNCSHMVHSQANTHSFIRWVWVNVTLPRLSGWWAVELPPSCYDLSDCSFKFPRINHLLMFVHVSLFVLVGVYSAATLAGRCRSKQWLVCVDCQQGGLSLAAIRGDSTGRDCGIPSGSGLEHFPGHFWTCF